MSSSLKLPLTHAISHDIKTRGHGFEFHLSALEATWYFSQINSYVDLSAEHPPFLYRAHKYRFHNVFWNLTSVF